MYYRDYYSYGWLNLIFKNIINKISIPNIHLFYLLFNNICSKIKNDGKVKDDIKKSLLEFYKDIINIEI
jgi:hypothetical protein